MRRVRRRSERRRREALHAPMEARRRGGGLPALRYADDGQGRHPAVLNDDASLAVDGAPIVEGPSGPPHEDPGGPPPYAVRRRRDPRRAPDGGGGRPLSRLFEESD